MTTNNGTAVARREQTALTPDGMGRSLLSQLSPAKKQILKNRIAIGASDADCELFLMQAESKGLDAWAMPPEVWLIQRRQKVGEQWVTQFIPQISKDGALRSAKRRGAYKSHTVEHYVEGQWYEDGDEPDGHEHPDRTRASIELPDGHTVRFVARWKERAQYTREGTLTEFWKRMPYEMLAKCALVGVIKLLPESDDIEIADEDFDDIGVSRRAFWAWADENDITEPTVRRCLLVGEGESLREAVERMGGWNKAKVYVEAKAASVKALPAGRPTHEDAMDLYRDPDEEAAVLDERTRQNRPRDPVELAMQQEARASSRLDGETHVANEPEPDPPPDGSYEDFHAGLEQQADALKSAVPDPVEPNPGSTACHACGAPSTGFDGSGREACDEHGANFVRPLDPPTNLLPLPSGADGGLTAFVDAARLHLDLNEAEVKRRITTLGSLTWRNVEPSEWHRRWAAIQTAPAK